MKRHELIERLSDYKKKAGESKRNIAGFAPAIDRLLQIASSQTHLVEDSEFDIKQLQEILSAKQMEKIISVTESQEIFDVEELEEILNEGQSEEIFSVKQLEEIFSVKQLEKIITILNDEFLCVSDKQFLGELRSVLTGTFLSANSEKEFAEATLAELKKNNVGHEVIEQIIKNIIGQQGTVVDKLNKFKLIILHYFNKNSRGVFTDLMNVLKEINCLSSRISIDWNHVFDDLKASKIPWDNMRYNLTLLKEEITKYEHVRIILTRSCLFNRVKNMIKLEKAGISANLPEDNKTLEKNSLIINVLGNHNLLNEKNYDRCTKLSDRKIDCLIIANKRLVLTQELLEDVISGKKGIIEIEAIDKINKTKARMPLRASSPAFFGESSPNQAIGLQIIFPPRRSWGGGK